MKLKTLVLAFCLPVLANAQFINFGINAGLGLGGLQADGLSVKSGLNPEFGAFIRYNFLERVSFQSLIDFELHKFTLTGGKQLDFPAGGGGTVVVAADDYSIKHSRVMPHLLVGYSLMDDKVELLAGGYWGIGFSANEKYGQPTVFYGATDEQIQSGSTDGFGNSAQIYSNFEVGRPGGATVAVTGGTDKFKVKVRYDHGLNKAYTNGGRSIKMKQNYIKLVLIYIIK